MVGDLNAPGQDSSSLAVRYWPVTRLRGGEAFRSWVALLRASERTADGLSSLERTGTMGSIVRATSLFLVCAFTFNPLASAQSGTRGGYSPAQAAAIQQYAQRRAAEQFAAQQYAAQQVARQQAALAANRGQQSQGFSVVELFTSQGCSSCPPADELLRRIDAYVRKNQSPVYCLSFHVDYWNRLGWKDPYSSKKSTERQRGYAAAAGGGQVYTPQMIVNGDVEFLGSDAKKAQRAIAGGLKQRPQASIELELVPSEGSGSITVKYAVEGETRGNVLNVAIVQSPEANRVSRGENVGRTLKHVNIVRAFRAVPLDRSVRGQVEIELPEDFDEKSVRAIGYMQNLKTLHIGGATEVALDRSASRTPT